MTGVRRLAHLKALREYELEKVSSYLPTSGRILEIGAGAGWQAKRLSELGYNVTALDLNANQLRSNAVFPVQDYDGHQIPFPDKYFDVVFSSNVLEHVVELDALEKEICRVVTQEGIMVHVLPTVAWRIWTSLTHPIYILQLACQHLQRKHQYAMNQKPKIASLPSVWQLLQYLFPRRHGVRGNTISELFLFSRRHWSVHFKSCGLLVLSVQPSGIFYSGNQIFNNKLALIWRHRISHLLGSVTLIWILKNKPKS
jgi:SAM-dependent methyltransferase